MELEAKLRVADHEPVRTRLVALGARFVRAGVETNVIFDRPDGSLAARGCGLRVRCVRVERGEPAAATMTVKGPPLPGPLKHREEIEVAVGDAERAIELLGLLGYEPVLRYEKRRESWAHRGCHVELDEPPHLGCFVEIEGPDAAAITAVQKDLDLADVPHEPRSYVALLMAQCRETGRSPLSLTLG